jgi:hypothetical protein
MARSTYDSSMAVAPARSGGGWKAMFWFAVAAAGVGFAGYVFLVPYQRMQSALGTRSAELGDARATVTEVTAERDKLKAALAKFSDAERDKASSEAKRKAAIDAVITQLRPGLEGLGATVAVEDGTLVVSFPADKVIDANGIDVSEGGVAALKVFAGSLKGASAKARILSRASTAAPPKELKSLFHSAGEQHAVRAARVLSALVDAGMSPTSLSIVGEAERAAPRTRGKKPASVPERLDIQVEPQ